MLYFYRKTHLAAFESSFNNSLFTQEIGLYMQKSTNNLQKYDRILSASTVEHLQLRQKNL